MRRRYNYMENVSISIRLLQSNSMRCSRYVWADARVYLVLYWVVKIRYC